MIKRASKIIILIVLLATQALSAMRVDASSLVHFSDTVSTSVTGQAASHEIRFFSPNGIPAGGRIFIKFEDGGFEIPSGFDYEDVDLAVSSSGSEEFSERSLTDMQGAASDGVLAITGTSSSISIDLALLQGIDPGSNIRIILGPEATYEAVATEGINNSSDLGAYRVSVETMTSSHDTIDRASTFVATTESVNVTANQAKIRANGKPTKDDVLIANSPITIMSLTTNYRAWCRYIGTRDLADETASTVPFALMTDSFTNSGDFYHSVFLYSLAAGYWRYYVRCIDHFGVVDTDSYLIEFRMAASGSGTTGEGDNVVENGTGTGGGVGDNEGSGSHSRGSGGGGGSGSGGGGGSGTGELLPYPTPLSQPDVILKGWAYPSSKVTILKDGKEEKVISADSKAEFSIEISQLNKGVYTFGVVALDSDGRQSETYSTTAWVNEGTKTTVSQIFIAPSMGIAKPSISVGEKLVLEGQTVPDTAVEVFYYSTKLSNPTVDQMTKKETTSGTNGRWKLEIDTTGLAIGTYKIKARANIALYGYSNFGAELNFGIGVSVTNNQNFKKSDLNKDGKVNLLDFSILLYHWNTDHDIADLNSDKKVNLIDFSMMMFDWTG